MKKVSLFLFSFAFIAAIGTTSFALDKSPPGKDQTAVVQKIEKENLCVSIVAEFPVQFTKENPAGDKIQMFAESTTLKDAPAPVVEDATLFYQIANKNDIKKRSRDVDYTKLGNSKAYWPV